MAGGFTIASVALVSCSSWLRAADSRTAARSANHASDFCALVLVGIGAGCIAGTSILLIEKPLNGFVRRDQSPADPISFEAAFSASGPLPHGRNVWTGRYQVARVFQRANGFAQDSGRARAGARRSLFHCQIQSNHPVTYCAEFNAVRV